MVSVYDSRRSHKQSNQVFFLSLYHKSAPCHTLRTYIDQTENNLHSFITATLSRAT